jgi:hypothetical protein
LQELRRLQEHTSSHTAYWAAAAGLRRLLTAEHAAYAALGCTLRSILSRAQLARWVVCSWPFFPSPADLMAALQQESAAAAAPPPGAAAWGLLPRRE